VITREFDAPRELVFDAWVTPEFLRRWLLGPEGWVMTVCEVDAQPGGRYRYEWHRAEDNASMGMGGVFREVVPPERLVATERFDDPWYPGEAVSTVILTERAGRTTLTQTVEYESSDAREGVLKSPMEEGLAAGFDRLEKLVSEQNLRTSD
jgi:uncharacterized protein YndB with AHSA1/START domain